MKKNLIGLIALIIGLAGIGLAITYQEIKPPPKTIISAAKDIFNSITGKPEMSSDQKTDISNVVRIFYLIFGFSAMGMGIVSWIRKDTKRLSFAAISTGIVAVSWEFVLIGVVIAVVIFILFNIDMFSNL
jgi:hypothetical protein